MVANPSPDMAENQELRQRLAYFFPMDRYVDLPFVRLSMISVSVNESIGIIPSGSNRNRTARVKVQQKKSSMNSKGSEYVSSHRNTSQRARKYGVRKKRERYHDEVNEL